MNKKLFKYFLIFSFLFAGITYVSADEDKFESIKERDSRPTPVLFQNKNNVPRPISTEIQRKKNIQEQYKQRLENIKSRYRERKEQTRTIRKKIATSTQDRLKKTREVIKEKKSLNRERIQERRELIKEKLKGQRKERVQNQVKRVVKNFEKIIERISRLEKKVDERIQSMKEKGFDMTKPEELIPVAQIAIKEALVRIQEMETALVTMLDSDNPSNAFNVARELTSPAKEAIREAHRSLINVIKSMRASIKTKNEEPATTKQDADNENKNSTE